MQRDDPLYATSVEPTEQLRSLIVDERVNGERELVLRGRSQRGADVIQLLIDRGAGLQSIQVESQRGSIQLTPFDWCTRAW